MLSNRTFAAYLNHFPAYHTTQTTPHSENCGTEIILLARDCKATPGTGIIFNMKVPS